MGLRVSGQDHATIGEWHCCLVQEGHFREPIGQQRARPIESTCGPALLERPDNWEQLVVGASPVLEPQPRRCPGSDLNQEIFPSSLAERSESLSGILQPIPLARVSARALWATTQRIPMPYTFMTCAMVLNMFFFGAPPKNPKSTSETTPCKTEGVETKTQAAPQLLAPC